MSQNKNLYKIFIILLIAVFSLPVLISITYVVPATDDLCAGIKIEKLREQHTLIESAIIFAKDSFFNWQGTYFGTFVWGFQPNFRNNSFFALRAILMCSFSLFVCGTFLYIFVLSKKVLKFSTASSYAMAGIFTILALNTTRGGGVVYMEYRLRCISNSYDLLSIFIDSINLVLLKKNLFFNDNFNNIIIFCCRWSSCCNFIRMFNAFINFCLHCRQK